MSYNQFGNQTRVAREQLKKTSTFQAGASFEHLKEPFADITFVGLRNWLTEVAGLKKKEEEDKEYEEKYGKFFDLMDSYIKLTELKSIQNSSEEAKFNLKIAAKDSDDFKDRRPLIEL